MISENKLSTSSFIFAILSAVLMGTIGVISKMTGLGPELVTFYRLFFGAVCMFLYLVVTRQTALLFSCPAWSVFVTGGFLSGFIIFYVAAMNYTSMANAIMLVYLAPVAASIIAHFFLNERLIRISLFLIAMALFGFAMMMEFKLDLATNSRQAIGIGLGCIALAAYAGFILMNRIIPKRVHVFNRTFYQLLTGALCMLPLVFVNGQEVEGANWVWLIVAGVFPGFLAILFAVVALSKLPAAIFGTLAYFEPIAVVIFGWSIFNESLTLLQLLGCAVIMFSGIAQAVLSSRIHS